MVGGVVGNIVIVALLVEEPISNAFPPIVVTELGIVILVRLVQF